MNQSGSCLETYSILFQTSLEFVFLKLHFSYMLKGVFINWGKGDRFIENGVGVGGCSHGGLNK